MAENGKTNTQKKEYDAKTVALAVVVAVVVLAGAAYYAGLFKLSPVVQPASQTPNLNASDVRLFLSAMQTEASLRQIHTLYTDTNDGASTVYEVAANQTDAWVKVGSDSGLIQGYFGADNSSYVVCLTFENKSECAKTGTDPNLAGIATNLKSILPDNQGLAASAQVDRALIAAGAMKFSGTVENDSINGFDTQKVSYVLDFSNLTVQELRGLGISPSDPAASSVTDRSIWIDRQSGLLIKSVATYLSGGAAHSFERNVASIETSKAVVPEKPEGLVSASTFSQFYQNAVNEYTQMSDCFVNNKSDVASCLKGVASENGDFRVCRLISDETQRGQCMLVVAQTTADAGPCLLAGPLADDCYIAVVGQTGNGDLCNNIQNSSLLQTCYKAKLAGDQAAAEKKAEMEQIIAGENCVADSGCKVAGNQNQYCTPANNTKPLGNETSPEFACLQGVSCGCVSGYCKFKENESANYSTCVDNFENQQLQAYIKSLIPAAAANQSTNASAANSTG